MIIAVTGKEFDKGQAAQIQELMDLLSRASSSLRIEDGYFRMLQAFGISLPSHAVSFSPKDMESDMIISIGGDGTFLKAAQMAVRKDIPILGINTGRLGFLSEVSPGEAPQVLEEIRSGLSGIQQRSMLEVICPSCPDAIEAPYALNEVSVLKHDNSSMIAIHTYLNGKLLNTYQADGLIVATPTGSTAYSLSVGGPIMMPETGTIALTPVAPHSLTCRPIVTGDTGRIRLEVESRSHNFLVSLDGRSQSLREGLALEIVKAPHKIKIITPRNHDYFKTLRGKMMWGMDAR